MGFELLSKFYTVINQALFMVPDDLAGLSSIVCGRAREFWCPGEYLVFKTLLKSIFFFINLIVICVKAVQKLEVVL